MLQQQASSPSELITLFHDGELVRTSESEDKNKFSNGDYVWIIQGKKLFAIAQIVEFIVDETNQYNGRYKVQYCRDKSFYHIKPDKMVPIFDKFIKSGLENQTATNMIVCQETRDFRLLAKSQVFKSYDFLQLTNNDGTIVKAGDFSLEIGSAMGETSKILFEKSAKLLCLDISKSYVAHCKNQYPLIEFWCSDIMDELDQKKVLKTWRKWKYENPSTQLKVFVDINGNRMLDAVSQVVDFVRSTMLPSIIVVKSSEYYQHCLLQMSQSSSSFV